MSAAPARYVAEPDGDLFNIIDTLTQASVGVVGDAVSAGRKAQSLNAFTLANERRLDRARLHQEVRALDRFAGAERLAELVALDPPCMTSLTVVAALCWVHGVRDYVARRFLRHLALESKPSVMVSELRSLGSLTARERRVFADHLARLWPEGERRAAA